MRSRTRLQNLLATAAILFAASGAQAGALPFTGSLSIWFRVSVDFPTAVISGAGTAIANGSSGGSHVHSLALAGSTFATSGLLLPITDPAAFPIQGMLLTAQNGAGTFSDGGGTLGGVMPLAGAARFCLFGPCSSPVANASIPLSVVGLGGAQTVGVVSPVTVIGAPWTTGTAAVGTLTAMGAAHGPASGTSSTFTPGGHLQLVTPIYIYSGFEVLPAFATLTIDFVPEPATLLLLGGGVAALAFAGRARYR